MSAQLAPSEQPATSRQAIQARTASKPRQVTGALATACKAIVWEGLALDVAAAQAGLTTRTLRLALERPHVIAWLKEQKDVFRAYVSSQNIHRAVDLRDKSGNAMARLGAMRFIEQLGDEQHGGGSTAARLPGLVVQIINNGSSATIEAKPVALPIDNHNGSE